MSTFQEMLGAFHENRHRHWFEKIRREKLEILLSKFDINGTREIMQKLEENVGERVFTSCFLLASRIGLILINLLV